MKCEPEEDCDGRRRYTTFPSVRSERRHSENRKTEKENN